jgi:hypothetical protein
MTAIDQHVSDHPLEEDHDHLQLVQEDPIVHALEV